jgi:hypothetical protein
MLDGDAHDSGARGFTGAGEDALSQRILSGPEQRRRTTADHRDGLGTVAEVSSFDGSSPKQLDSHGGEEVGTDAVDADRPSVQRRGDGVQTTRDASGEICGFETLSLCM